MRLAQEIETRDTTSLYLAGAEFAREVGHIDWPSPFPEEQVLNMIALQQLYVWDVDETVSAAA